MRACVWEKVLLLKRVTIASGAGMPTEGCTWFGLQKKSPLRLSWLQYLGMSVGELGAPPITHPPVDITVSDLMCAGRTNMWVGYAND